MLLAASTISFIPLLEYNLSHFTRLNPINMRADFYLLTTQDIHDRNTFICRLVEKIYQQNLSIYLHCKNREESDTLDELLWTFSDTSFIPHCLEEESHDFPAPIKLGFDKTPKSHDVLINLSTSVPIFYTKFRRIAECVIQNDEDLTISREHYQFYKSQNIEIKTHKM